MQEQLHEIMKYETISSNVALLQLPNKNFYLVSRGVNFLHRKRSQPFVACPPYDDLKISPQPICSSKSHKYENYDKTTYSLLVLLVLPGKPLRQAIHYPMANFRPLFDHHLTPRSPGTW